jgi:hypothetical protein
MTQDQLNTALRGRTVSDVQLLDNGAARIVFSGVSLEIAAVGLIYPGAAKTELHVVEGGQ